MGSLVRRLGLFTCVEVGRVLARRSRRARRRRGRGENMKVLKGGHLTEVAYRDVGGVDGGWIL